MRQQFDEDRDKVDFYTDTGKNVTKLINENKTVKFQEHKDAYAFARERNTYVYELFAEFRGKRLSYGYAVPM